MNSATALVLLVEATSPERFVGNDVRTPSSRLPPPRCQDASRADVDPTVKGLEEPDNLAGTSCPTKTIRLRTMFPSAIWRRSEQGGVDDIGDHESGRESYSADGRTERPLTGSTMSAQRNATQALRRSSGPSTRRGKTRSARQPQRKYA